MTVIIGAIAVTYCLLWPSDQWHFQVTQDAALIMSTLIMCTSGIVHTLRDLAKRRGLGDGL